MYSIENVMFPALVQVTVVDSNQVSCRLLMPDFVDHKLDDYISRVLMRYVQHFAVCITTPHAH